MQYIAWGIKNPYVCNVRNGTNNRILAEISDIRTGLTVRKDIHLLKNGSIALLQPKDISEGKLVNEPSYIDEPRGTIQQHLLIKGELLIANKGQKFNTFLYKNQYPASIASASFFVIKTDDRQCFSEYLQWFLELRSTKEYLLRNSITSTIPSLSKSVLGNMQIPVPALEIQQKIINMSLVIKRQKEAAEKLIVKADEYLNSYAWEMILDKQK